MKLGTVGFLMNHYRADDLPERLVAAEPAVLRPLEMTAITESGSSVSLLAYNEVSLLRQTRQTAHVCIERSEEHTSELQSLMRISYAVFCLQTNRYTATPPSTLPARQTRHAGGELGTSTVCTADTNAH